MRKNKKHPLDALFAPGVTRLEQDCIIAQEEQKHLRALARKRARGEVVEEPARPALPEAKRPVRLPLRAADDSPSYVAAYDSLVSEHLVVPKLEGEPLPRSPREWREEHLDWMSRPGVAELYEDKETPAQLEATTYWDYCHGKFVPMCPACLEYRAQSEFRLTREHKCRKCGHVYDGREAVRASYLLLLGEKHPDFNGVDDVFRFLAYIFGPEPEQERKRPSIKLGDQVIEGEPPAWGVEAMLDQYEYCCNEAKVAQRRANAKALALFRKLFGKRKYDRFVNYGELWVDGPDGRQYRIFYSHHGNVAVYDPGTRRRGVKWKPVAAYCGHFGETYPVVDQVIAQALMFKTDPEKYIAQANRVEHQHMAFVGPVTNYYEEMRESLAYA